MVLILEITRILLPIIIISGIAIIVIVRMKHKYNKGTFGKKKSKTTQNLDSLISFGMMIGTVIAVILSMIFSISLLSTIGWGAGVGLLFGYFAYEICGTKGESHLK